MDLHWQHPEWLWALAALPVVALLTWRSRALPTRRARVLCAALRCAVCVLLPAALAQPYATRETPDAGAPAVVFLVDRSESLGVSDDAVDARVAEYQRSLPAGVKTTVLNFAGDTWPAGAAGPHPTDETNLEQALRAAAGEFPDSPNRQVVLFTDGRATTGDAAGAAEELHARGEVVHAVAVGRNVRRGPRLTGLTPPAQATIGQPARLTVRLASDWPANALVRVRDAHGVEQASRSIAVDGERAVVLLVKPEQRGVQEWSVAVSDAARPPGEAATVAAPFFVEGAPKVLLADPFPDETGYLDAALAQLQLEVDKRPLDQWPRHVSDLSQYDAAIISDWPSPDLDPAQLRTLQEFVDRRGGGLLFIGGSNVKTQAWKDSGLEDLLPIEFAPQDERPVPPPSAAHVCFVLDRSGSMQGWKLDMVKVAIAQSLDRLPPNSTVSVIAFDAHAERVVDRQPLADRDQIIERVNRIGSAGGTLMGTAVRMGLDQLRITDAPRYMVILSDGQTGDGDQMTWTNLGAALAAENVRVTGIAVGPDAERRLFAFLALQTGGTFYYSPDASSIPAVFIEQAQKITDETQQEAVSFRPQPGPQVQNLKSITCAQLPALTGYVAATAKPDGLVQVPLLRDARAVLLASWRQGLGRVVAFTSSVKPAWAAGWIAAPDTAPFWAEVVRWTLSDAKKYRADLQGRVDGRRVRTLLRVVDAETGALAGGLSGAGTMESLAPPPGPAQPMVCRELRPGLYEFSGTCASAGNHVCRLQLFEGQDLAFEAASVVRPSATPELAFTGPDPTALAALCQSANGRLDPPPEEIAQRAAERPAVEILATVQYWPFLLLLATCLWPVDLALRRWLAARGADPTVPSTSSPASAA